jgi:hypothetical protein
MLRSGNDAAVAIAEHIGGTVENFANLMNRKAYQIGQEIRILSILTACMMINTIPLLMILL